MTQDLIFAPMGAMALLTFGVLLQIPIRRFAAVLAGRVRPEDFQLGESPAVPGDVAIPNRNYMNLLELPTLFFPACLMFYVTGRVDAVVLTTALALRPVPPSPQHRPPDLQQRLPPPHRLRLEQRHAGNALAAVLHRRALNRKSLLP